MPIRGAALYDDLAGLLRVGVAPALEPDAWFDAHTHLGQNDPDGTKATLQELLEGMDTAGHARALVFPMHEPGGYPPANEAVAAAVEQAGGRLRWLCRVDPKAAGAVAELERCLAAGASGLKLHPRSDEFGLPHPVVDELVARCAEDRRPVLFHAGRGIPKLGEGAAALARRHPGTPIILAHAGISDLGLLAAAAAELSNLYFDTSWWHCSDLLQLLVTVPAGQVLYASDMPYGPGLVAAFNLRRCAAQAGLGEDVMRSIAGAQLVRLLAGEDPASFGAPAGLGAVGPRDVRLERLVAHTTGAITAAFRGGEPAEAVAMARLACQHDGDDEHGSLLAACDRLRARSAEHREASDGDPLGIIPCTMVAHMCAGTPRAGAPDLG
jgi:predicted TIM-barrel fold metal-dependent hydrolase